MFEKAGLRKQIKVKATYIVGMGFAYNYSSNVISLRVKIMLMKSK